MNLFFINEIIHNKGPNYTPIMDRPCGLMDKASDFESEDCEFESRRGRIFFSHGAIFKTELSRLTILIASFLIRIYQTKI